MADIVSPSTRSRMMAAVRQRHTKPELTVRSSLHNLGFRFRLHPKDLPGRPDILLPKYRTAIFVHGCFWHQHAACAKSRRPASRVQYWNRKLDDNIARDARKEAALDQLGWRIVVIWGCEAEDKESLQKRLLEELSCDR
jgi:DNA mismatch endonuclease (patch repair protein)